MYQFYEESNEAHDAESDGSSDSDLLELFPVRLCASPDQSDGVLSELLARLDELSDLIHYFEFIKLLDLSNTMRSAIYCSNSSNLDRKIRT